MARADNFHMLGLFWTCSTVHLFTLERKSCHADQCFYGIWINYYSRVGIYVNQHLSYIDSIFYQMRPRLELKRIVVEKETCMKSLKENIVEVTDLHYSEVWKPVVFARVFHGNAVYLCILPQKVTYDIFNICFTETTPIWWWRICSVK